MGNTFRHPSGMVTVEQERSLSTAKVQLTRFDWDQPLDSERSEQEDHRLDLCLTPRPNARANYKERWGPHRFERIGEVLFVPAGEPLRARSEVGSQASVICELRPEPLKQWFDGDFEWTSRHVEAGVDVTEDKIRGLMLRMAQELRQPGFASDVLIELVAAQLAIELARYCSSLSEPAAAGALSPWRMHLIEERLMEVRGAPTLGELAALTKMSVRQLTRGFRASRGCSIGDYVAQRRIDMAKRLLAGDESIKSVAFSLGFASPSSFSQAFRAATGMTPRQFREATDVVL